MSRFTEHLPAYQAHMRALSGWLSILDHFRDDPDLRDWPKQTAEALRMTPASAVSQHSAGDAP